MTRLVLKKSSTTSSIRFCLAKERKHLLLAYLAQDLEMVVPADFYHGELSYDGQILGEFESCSIFFH